MSGVRASPSSTPTTHPIGLDVARLGASADLVGAPLFVSWHVVSSVSMRTPYRERAQRGAGCVSPRHRPAARRSFSTWGSVARWEVSRMRSGMRTITPPRLGSSVRGVLGCPPVARLPPPEPQPTPPGPMGVPVRFMYTRSRTFHFFLRLPH